MEEKTETRQSKANKKLQKMDVFKGENNNNMKFLPRKKNTLHWVFLGAFLTGATEE